MPLVLLGWLMDYSSDGNLVVQSTVRRSSLDPGAFDIHARSINALQTSELRRLRLDSPCPALVLVDVEAGETSLGCSQVGYSIQRDAHTQSYRK